MVTSRKKKHEEAVAKRERWFAELAESNRRNLEKARAREQQIKEMNARKKAEAKRKAKVKAAMKKLRPKEGSNDNDLPTKTS